MPSKKGSLSKKLTCSVIGVYITTALLLSGKICAIGKSKNSVADELNFHANDTFFGFASNSHSTLTISCRAPL